MEEEVKKSEDKNINVQIPVPKNTDRFKDGAIAGAILGSLLAIYFNRSILIGAIVGIVGGGYIGYRINQAHEEKVKFENPNQQ